nr:hypothetical protein [Tanacetum cinerariifolium]
MEVFKICTQSQHWGWLKTECDEDDKDNQLIEVVRICSNKFDEK